MQRKLKVLDLFSGIGGFALGLDSTGIFETVKFVEKDKYCKKVLQKNFPNIPIEEDIKDVKGKEGDADVIVGGFPCQPMSVAGKRKGTDDDRYLWPEMFRLIREIKPQFVIGENVQGIINIQNGMVLRQVQDDLESEGFEVQCFLIPASGIGAWHQRYRVWIVGHSEHNGSLASKIERRDTETTTRTQKGTITTSEPERTSGSRNNENVSNTDSGIRGGWRTIRESGENKVWRFYSEKEEQTTHDLRSKTVGRDALLGKEKIILQSNNERQQKYNTSKESEGQTLSGGGHVTDEAKQTWWQVESNLCGIPDGISYELDKDRASRIKTLGNAIVPQIAREIGLAIKKVL
jgi:DNA (cytosine-5)-methyltransferase 1